MRELKRSDIVGKRVQAVFEKPPSHGDDISVFAVFVELDDGTLIEFSGQDPFEVLPIYAVDKGVLHLATEADAPAVLECIGRTICEVVTSCYFPTFALFLDNGMLLYQSDISPFVVRAVASGFEKYCSMGTENVEVVTYWEHQPLIWCRGPAINDNQNDGGTSPGKEP